MLVDRVNLEKPPLGLMPRKLHIENRITDILNAMIRYVEVGKNYSIPDEWYDELRSLGKDISIINEKENNDGGGKVS